MALADIITLIETESTAKADSVLKKAKEEAETLQEKSLKVADEYISSLEKSATEEQIALEKRSVASIARTERVAVATAQKEVLDDVFRKTLDALCALKGDSLIAVFTALVKEISAEKGSIVILGFGKSEMETAVKNTGKSFSVSESTEDSRGGFVFQGEGFEMDFSFDALVSKELRPKKEGEIFKKLFS